MGRGGGAGVGDHVVRGAPPNTIRPPSWPADDPEGACHRGVELFLDGLAHRLP